MFVILTHFAHRFFLSITVVLLVLSSVFYYKGIWNANGQTQLQASTIGSGSSALYATSPQTGDIFKYNGVPNSWTRIGDPASMIVASK